MKSELDITMSFSNTHSHNREQHKYCQLASGNWSGGFHLFAAGEEFSRRDRIISSFDTDLCIDQVFHADSFLWSDLRRVNVTRVN